MPYLFNRVYEYSIKIRNTRREHRAFPVGLIKIKYTIYRSGKKTSQEKEREKERIERYIERQSQDCNVQK